MIKNEVLFAAICGAFTHISGLPFDEVRERLTAGLAGSIEGVEMLGLDLDPLTCERHIARCRSSGTDMVWELNNNDPRVVALLTQFEDALYSAEHA